MDYLTLTTTHADKAIYYAQLIYQHSQLPGAHNTPAAIKGEDYLSHLKGKYGEVLFYTWLKQQQGLRITHTPFREDYTKKCKWDDFIVNRIQVEVKTKRRSVRSIFPPPMHYNANIGQRSMFDYVYVFVEVDPVGEIINNPTGVITGWADLPLLRERARIIHAGDLSDTGTFRFGKDDWDININDLYSPGSLLERLR